MPVFCFLYKGTDSADLILRGVLFHSIGAENHKRMICFEPAPAVFLNESTVHLLNGMDTVSEFRC